MQPFTDYLKAIHYQENPELLDDELPDDFDRWLSTMEQDVLIHHADDWSNELLIEIKDLKNYNQALEYKIEELTK